MLTATMATQLQMLRRRTGAGIVQCKRALDAALGDVEIAVERLRQEGAAAVETVETRAVRRTAEGLIVSYVHHNGRLGALVEVNCETDFVARTDDFAVLAHRIAEQVAAAAPVAVERADLPPDLVERKREMFEREARAMGKPESIVARIAEGKFEAFCRANVLMEQAWVREPKITVAELVNELAAATGEHVRVLRFSRLHMGIA